MFACTGAPAAHVSVVHSLPSSIVSVSSGTSFSAPAPSHSTCLQSLGTCCWTTLPSASSCVPHVPASHVAVAHSVPVAGQSSGTQHCSVWQSAVVVVVVVAPPLPPLPLVPPRLVVAPVPP